MDMMLLGETIVAAGADQDYLGFWMPAGGNDGVAGLQVFYSSATSAFQVFLETKKSDEADSDAGPIGNAYITAATPQSYKFDVTQAEDLVRYKVTSLKAGAVHLQFAQPLWQPN